MEQPCWCGERKDSPVHRANKPAWHAYRAETARKPKVVEEAMEPSERARKAAETLLASESWMLSDTLEGDAAALALAFEEYGREVRREEREMWADRWLERHDDARMLSHRHDKRGETTLAAYWQGMAEGFGTVSSALRASPRGQAGEREGE